MSSGRNYKTTEIGELPTDWTISPLPKLLSFIVDNRGKTVPTSESGIPLIATNCIKENALYPVKERLRYLSQDIYDTWFRSHPIPNDILFVNKGTPGQVCLVPNPIDFCIAQDMVALRANSKEVNWKFLFAYLRSKGFKKQVEGLNVGTTIPHLKKSVFNQLLIPIPPPGEQEVIGDLYFELSNKIELNLQMNQTLEAMAKAIFNEWFVNFNFLGFDGELVDGLPKGWRMGKLGDVCERITKGTTPTTLKKQFVEKGINFIKAEGIDDFGNFIPEKFAFIDEETNEMLKRSIVQEKDIVFTIAGTLGRVAKVDKSILPANTNQAVAIIRVSDYKLVNFVYHLLRSDLIKSTLINKAVHAVQANISLGVLSAAEIVIPNEKTIQLFNEILNPIEEKLLSNVYETRTLTQIRDSLLPKLMTGKIEIK